MARISLTPPRTLLARFAARYSRRRYGALLDPVAALSHNSRVLVTDALLEWGVMRWRSLDPTLHCIATQLSASMIGCSWCTDFGYWEAHHKGVDPAKIRAVPQWRTSEVYSDVERLVLEYTEAMTVTPPAVTDDLVERLRGAPVRRAARRAHRARRGGEPALAHQRRARPAQPGVQGPVRRAAAGPLVVLRP